MHAAFMKWNINGEICRNAYLSSGLALLYKNLICIANTISVFIHNH